MGDSHLFMDCSRFVRLALNYSINESFDPKESLTLLCTYSFDQKQINSVLESFLWDDVFVKCSINVNFIVADINYIPGVLTFVMDFSFTAFLTHSYLHLLM